MLTKSYIKSKRGYILDTPRNNEVLIKEHSLQPNVNLEIYRYSPIDLVKVQVDSTFFYISRQNICWEDLAALKESRIMQRGYKYDTAAYVNKQTAIEFCKSLSEITGIPFRLPTRLQYAAQKNYTLNGKSQGWSIRDKPKVFYKKYGLEPTVAIKNVCNHFFYELEGLNLIDYSKEELMHLAMQKYVDEAEWVSSTEQQKPFSIVFKP